MEIHEKILIALISEMIDAEETGDGENRAIYGRVAKMIVSGSYMYDPEVQRKLNMLADMAKKKDFSPYENRF